MMVSIDYRELDMANQSLIIIAKLLSSSGLFAATTAAVITWSVTCGTTNTAIILVQVKHLQSRRNRLNMRHVAIIQLCPTIVQISIL